MNEFDIMERLETAAAELLKHQPDLFNYTAATHQTEWNISHHYANEVCAFFPGYACDLELLKPDSGDRRPDIVFHHRNTHDHNLLIIEVKRNREDVGGELRKIREHWFADPLHYRYGAVVVINEHDSPHVEVMANQR